MSKRSDFERKDKDKYYTWDKRAVLPLIPHLIGPSHTGDYIEPCAGDGSLIRLLREYCSDARCIKATDIEPDGPLIEQKDFFDYTKDDVTTAFPGEMDLMIITNPPWSRPILHKMIDHVIDLKVRTWFLFDADWMHTKQSAPYIPFCERIVSVGRVRWQKDTKMDGKDNCAWYCFDGSYHKDSCLFFGRKE